MMRAFTQRFLISQKQLISNQPKSTLLKKIVESNLKSSRIKFTEKEAPLMQKKSSKEAGFFYWKNNRQKKRITLIMGCHFSDT